MAETSLELNAKPTKEISVREVFGIDTDMIVHGFEDRTSRVPTLDSTYKFDPDTTLAILAGFNHNRRVMIQGYHGTGKSTHIEQVASLLNWPCVRVNLEAQRWQASHRFPGRHPAVGVAQPDRDRIR